MRKSDYFKNKQAALVGAVIRAYLTESCPQSGQSLNLKQNVALSASLIGVFLFTH